MLHQNIDGKKIMKLIIVRHGATDHNISRVIQGRLDIPLNIQGLEQADELGGALAVEKIDRIFSSDLTRARSTTEAILRNNQNISVEYLPTLQERHYGEFQNGPVSNLLLAKKNYEGEWDQFEPCGGESQLAFHERIRCVWQSIMSNTVADCLLFSVHGGVAKSLITHAQKENLCYRSTIVQDNCCLNILYGDYNAGFTAELINSVAHLSDPTGLEGL